MKWFGRIIIALVLVAGIGLAIYSQKSDDKPVAPPAPQVSAPPSPSPTPTPSPSEMHYPVPTETSATNSPPLPRVDESDGSMEAELKKLIGKDSFQAIFNPKDIIRRIVVSIDNAPKHVQISQEFSPFKALPKNFHVTGPGDDLVISRENFNRYSLYFTLAKRIDATALANLYVHLYPLFQSAYQDLGVKGYFNDRVVAAIDVILSTPETTEPIKLIRAPVHPVYKFADEKLEALPAVQKIMIRMGTENAAMIQAKLRELREIFTHLDQLKTPKGADT